MPNYPYQLTILAQEVFEAHNPSKGMISASPVAGYSRDLTFDAVEKEIKTHKGFNHPLFIYLKEQSKEGFNAEQFQIYRDNFFCRTELTIPSVAKSLAAAASTGDFQAVADTARNLYDECGYGNPNLVHGKLLLDSHNQHGWKIFGVTPLGKIQDAQQSRFLVSGVFDYRDSKMEVFNKSYAYITGNTWAHELAADGMLDDFRQALFDPYEKHYTKSEYEKVIAFYKAHKDDSKDGGDVEANHGRMARAAAERACNGDPTKIQEMRRGAMEFLHRQTILWDDMLGVIMQAKEKGNIVKPALELEAENTPNSIISGRQGQQNAETLLPKPKTQDLLSKL